MGAETKIEWANHTFNHIRGCTKVSAGCANCYADTGSLRNPKVLGKWGPNGTRVVASENAEAGWAAPVKWNKAAAEQFAIYEEHKHQGGPAYERPRVFCASLADVFEDWQGPIKDSRGLVGCKMNNNGHWGFGPDFVTFNTNCTNATALTMDDVRARLFQLIDATPNLDWLVLTKRPENIIPMTYSYWGQNGLPQEKRDIRPQVSFGRGIDDRSHGPNLEDKKTDGRSLEGRHTDNAMPQEEGRNGEQGGIFASQNNEERETALCGSAPSGLASLQGDNSAGIDHKSQKREEKRQSPAEPGVSDLQRTAGACPLDSESQSQPTKRRTSSENIPDGCQRLGDSQTTSGRRTSEGYRRGLQDEAQGDQRNLLPTNMGSYLKLPPNLWLGVSVEDQANADKRIPELLKIPAAVRFVSYEPALGPVQFDVLGTGDAESTNALTGERSHAGFGGRPGYSHQQYRQGINWIIVGGESGPNARPFDLRWARGAVKQCKAAGVACFVKQLGACPEEPRTFRPYSGVSMTGTDYLKLADKKGGDIQEFPEDLRVREFPTTSR